ncbi:MAG: HEPN domain-containing protein [Elusimicrobia bacterium]|nr:HEPN domain-containing protein [Elusimicrobiota bacterium]
MRCFIRQELYCFLRISGEKSHHCLIIALRALYVDKKLLQASLVESLQKAKLLRENADYYDDWSESSAKSLIRAAEQFLDISKKLILDNKSK